MPVNQTIEFDEGPKITVFIGESFELVESLDVDGGKIRLQATSVKRSQMG
jgi:hypothetical protein